MRIVDSTVHDPDPSNPVIVWIGDRPGTVEQELGRTWVGPSGRLLRDHYLRPLPPAHHHLTNVLIEYHVAKPAASVYKARYPALRATLLEAGSRPCSSRVVVFMGAEATSFAHSLDKSLPSSITKALSHQLREIQIDDQTWTVLFTYNPAHLLEQPNLARAADNHHNLLTLHLKGRMPARSRPRTRPTRGPRPTDPTTICLDIETYGAVAAFDDGTPSPSQKDTERNGRFHPARSVYEDRPKRLVSTVSITLPERETATDHPLVLWSGAFSHSRETLRNLKPGPTFTFNMERSDHRALVGSWLRHARTILGHNLLFDLQYLMFGEPLARAALAPFSKDLIDTTILAYLQDETRPEKSLKVLGPLLGIFVYDDDTTLRHRRFRRSSDPLLHRYNAEDTHNTMLTAASLAALIEHEWYSTDKAQAECLAFYSRTMWSVLPMLEAGVPFSIPALLNLEAKTQATIERTEALCLEAGVQISGTGSKKSSMAFVSSICGTVPGLLQHELFKLTEKRKEISVSALNLKLCKYHLPDGDPRHAVLDAWLEHSSASKLMSSYIVPLLYATKNSLKYAKKEPHKLDRSSTLIPEIKPCSYRSLLASSSSATSSTSCSTSPSGVTIDPCPSPVGIAYPRIYITPSSVTDTSDDQGGTEQMRFAIKGPALQTIPPAVQACQTARRAGWGLWEWDLGQIELKVPAMFSGEKKLIDAAITGFDLHTDQALTIFGVLWLQEKLGTTGPIDKSTPGFDPYRQCAKQVNFAGAYWATAKTMQSVVFRTQEFYVDLAVFERAVRARPTQMPDFFKWQCSLQREATSKGYLDLPLLGLSRHFVGGTEFHQNTILNFRTQALAAAVLLDIQHRVMAARPKNFFATYQVHDSLKGEYKLGCEQEVKDALNAAVAECSTRGVWGVYQAMYGHRVPLSADFKFKPGAPHE